MSATLIAAPETTNPAPARSLEQRMTALDAANTVRSARALLKRDIKAGRVSFLALIADPPDYLVTAKVYDILLHVPKVGRVKAQKAFKHHQISPSKTFGGLSRRQRDQLVGDRNVQGWARA